MNKMLFEYIMPDTRTQVPVRNAIPYSAICETLSFIRRLNIHRLRIYSISIKINVPIKTLTLMIKMLRFNLD